MIELEGNYKGLESIALNVFSSKFHNAVNDRDMYIGVYGSDIPKDKTRKVLLFFNYTKDGGDQDTALPSTFERVKMGVLIQFSFSESRDTFLDRVQKVKQFVNDEFKFSSLEISSGYDSEEKQYNYMIEISSLFNP